MNKYQSSAILLLTVFLTLARAEETAVVTDNKVNVRGGPSFVREVVTQMQKGDKVTVLERVTAEKAKPGEPTNWAKIKLPPNTPVWVFAPFVKDHKVSVSKLNLRGGPGENYSVLGRLVKGDDVKEVRTVEEWMQIETPEQANGFLDSKYLKPGEPDAIASKPADAAAVTTVAAAETVAEKKPETSPEPAKPEPPKPEETKPAPEPAREEPKEEKPAQVETVKQPDQVAETKDAARPVETKPAPVVPPPIVPPPSTPEATPKLPEVAPAPEPPPSDAPLPKRIVRREGLVKGTVSIQAPSYFELVNSETKKVMNYLHTEDLDIHFKKFNGKRVVVSGEEGIDSRWPNTPVIEVDTIETAP